MTGQGQLFHLSSEQRHTYICDNSVYKLQHGNLFIRVAEEDEEILNVDRAKGKFLEVDANMEAQINERICELHKGQLENKFLHIISVMMI